MTGPSANPINIPEAFLSRMARLLGTDYQEFIDSFSLPATSGLRVNTLKVSAGVFLSRSRFRLTPVPWCSTGFIIDDDLELKISPGKHPYHAAGLYYLQEPSAMAAAEILSPQPGEKVLDLCAAPGGKATHLAALMNNSGLLFVNEIHPKRVWDLAENLERCGITNAVITNETPERMANHFGEYFDRVLLDAPCSGEGMFRKGEIARKEWKQELVHSCSIRQASILEQAARLVKPGGYIAYTTCTFSPEENEGVIDNFISQHHEFDLISIPLMPGYQPARPEWISHPSDHRISQAIRIWPYFAQAEGHFIALLVKRGSNIANKGDINTGNRSLHNRTRKLRELDKVRAIWDDFCLANLKITLDHTRLIAEGTYIYLLPEDSPYLKGLKVIHPGWWLGSIRKYRFMPSHALAMSINNHQARHELPLTLGDTKLSAYFSGQSFPDSGEDGWILVTVDDFPVGWGKRVQNMIKNFYPRGLRHSS
jgi:NOL1/NOP2/sun family putative RNA methylase